MVKIKLALLIMLSEFLIESGRLQVQRWHVFAPLFYCDFRTWKSLILLRYSCDHIMSQTMRRRHGSCSWSRTHVMPSHTPLPVTSTRSRLDHMISVIKYTVSMLIDGITINVRDFVDWCGFGQHLHFRLFCTLRRCIVVPAWSCEIFFKNKYKLSVIIIYLCDTQELVGAAK